MQLFARVRAFVRQHDLIRSATRVVAAVSGGSDSVALAHILARLAADGVGSLAGIVHVNHQLRPTAARDEAIAGRLAAALGVPFAVESEEVAAYAARVRKSIEAAAHDVRCAAYTRARERFGADVVAVGHTRDDQAETFLLRLVRGAGLRGFSGIHPRNGEIVRPLLDCARAELRGWLDERRRREREAFTYADDETNADVAIPRNRIRAELLPLLAERYNPGIVAVLAREAEQARKMWEFLEQATDMSGPGLDVDRLRLLPEMLQSVVVMRAMRRAAAGRMVAAQHVDAVLRLLDDTRPRGVTIEAPGVIAQRIGHEIVLTSRSAFERRTPMNLFRYALSIPGEVSPPGLGWRLSADPMSGRAEGALAWSAGVGNGPTALVRADLIQGTLIVRNRRPGDRFRPVGLRGSKKVQDLFVDRKVPRAERDAVPLVVDDQDRIVWVAGHGIDEAFRVTGPSQHVIILKFKALGGSA